MCRQMAQFRICVLLSPLITYMGRLASIAICVGPVHPCAVLFIFYPVKGAYAKLQWSPASVLWCTRGRFHRVTFCIEPHNLPPSTLGMSIRCTYICRLRHHEPTFRSSMRVRAKMAGAPKWWLSFSGSALHFLSIPKKYLQKRTPMRDDFAR